MPEFLKSLALLHLLCPCRVYRYTHLGPHPPDLVVAGPQPPRQRRLLALAITHSLAQGRDSRISLEKLSGLWSPSQWGYSETSDWHAVNVD